MEWNANFGMNFSPVESHHSFRLQIRRILRRVRLAPDSNNVHQLYQYPNMSCFHCDDASVYQRFLAETINATTILLSKIVLNITEDISPKPGFQRVDEPYQI